jgi:hypothetical protein
MVDESIEVTVIEDEIIANITDDVLEVVLDQADGVWVRRSGDSMSGDLNMTGSSIRNIGSLLFDLTASGAIAEGELNWNAEDGTLQIGMPGGEVVIQISQEQTFLAKNTTESLITNGSPIVIIGATGARPEIRLAATTPQETSGSIGMTTQDIGVNQNGYVTTFGYVRDIDTSAIAAGARAFLSDTPGELSASLPAVANRKTFMGIIIRSNVNGGVILLSPINILFLDELSGMNFTNLQDGDIPVYHAASKTWINQQP